jgi:hypothetical protein
MRMPLLLIAAAVTVLHGVGPADAQRYDPRYPVCLHVYTGGGRGGGSDWFECAYTSLEQCRASASARAATCDINPYYVADRPPPPRARRAY